MQKTRLAIFASGAGSNAVNLIRFFSEHPSIQVVEVVCNRPDAPVVQRVKELNIPCYLISNQEAANGAFLRDRMAELSVDGIILAGYLRQIPKELIQHYPERIINLHPSLLPQYGGAGMYGDRVHEAVLANQEKKTGITIHFVNEEYDKGAILAQFEISIQEDMKLDELKKGIAELEQKYFPLVVERTFKNTSDGIL